MAFPDLETMGGGHIGVIAGPCSVESEEQLLATAERYFAHLDEVQVLVIDPARLTSELRYELPTGADSPDELFPHLYGPIEALAVLGTTRLQRAGGRFTWADEAFPEGEVPSRQEKAAT